MLGPATSTVKSSAKPFQTGIIIGTLLASSPLLGLLGTAYGMFRSFGTLQGPGISDPQALSHGMSLALYSSAVGLVLCPVGVVILIVSLVLRARARTSSPPPLPSSPIP